MKRISVLPFACAALIGLAEPVCGQDVAPSTGATEATSGDPAAEKAQKAWHQAAAEATRNHLRTVAARGDARSLLAAAMLWPQWQEGASNGVVGAIAQEKRAWFEAARDARPRDPLVAWVEAGDCGGLSDSCDRDGALAFLLQSEPDNAAVHLLALAVADRTGGPEPAEALWQSAALARTHDVHGLELGQLLHSAMSDASMPPLTPALALAMGQSFGAGRETTQEELRNAHAMAVWAAFALPVHHAVTRGCSTDAPAPLPPQRQAQCERIMALLAEDQSILVAPMIGLRKMVELAGDRPDGAPWRERLRQFYWIYENAQRSMSPGAGALPPEYLDWVLQEGELPAMRKLLEANGLPAAPPAGWLPERADVRALLDPALAEGRTS